MPWILLNLRMMIRQAIEMTGNIFLVNIGVNSSHSAKSPIFSDRTHEPVGPRKSGGSVAPHKSSMCLEVLALAPAGGPPALDC